MKKISFLFLLSFVYLFAGCSQESGSPYSPLTPDTQPTVNLGADIDGGGGLYVPNFLSFDADSADPVVYFGQQAFRFLDNQNPPLYFYLDLDNDEINDIAIDSQQITRQIIQEDIRGIRTLQETSYAAINQDSDNLNLDQGIIQSTYAQDRLGNVHLLAFSRQGISDSEPTVLTNPVPYPLYPSKVQVGETWLTSFAPNTFLVPTNGWQVTLLDDDAIAPISGEENTILLLFQYIDGGFYLYLKPGIGVVEQLALWLNENGKVKPILGVAKQIQKDIGLGSDFITGGHNNPLVGISQLPLLVQSYQDKLHFNYQYSEAIYLCRLFLPAAEYGRCYSEDGSNSDYLSFSFLFDPQSKALTLANQDLALPTEDNYFQPIFELQLNGQQFFVNAEVGDIQVRNYYPLEQPYGFAMLNFYGNLYNPESEQTFPFNIIIASPFFNQQQLGSVILDADIERILPRQNQGQTIRLHWLNPTGDLTEKLFWGNSPDNINNSFENIQYFCFSNSGAISNCEGTNNRAATFTSTATGTLYLQLRTDNPFFNSLVYQLPIEENTPQQLPIARITSIENIVEPLTLTLPENNSLTAAFSAIHSRAPGRSIVDYRWTINGEELPETFWTIRQTFQEPGDYTIGLTVTDSLGQTASDSYQVLVRKQGQIIFRNISLAQQTIELEIYTLSDNGAETFLKSISQRLAHTEEWLVELPVGQVYALRYATQGTDPNAQQKTEEKVVSVVDGFTEVITITP